MDPVTAGMGFPLYRVSILICIGCKRLPSKVEDWATQKSFNSKIKKYDNLTENKIIAPIKRINNKKEIKETLLRYRSSAFTLLCCYLFRSSETGKVLTSMQAGDFFGEIGILNLDGLNK